MSRVSILDLEYNLVQQAINRVKTGIDPYFGPYQTNSTKCWLAMKTKNKKSGTKGYCKIKVGGLKKGGGGRAEYYVHHLILILHNRKDELRQLADGKQVSHLCHNPNCFQPEHLVVEDAAVNLSRNKCIRVSCPCCKTIFSNCTHQPQCILSLPEK